MESKDRRTGWLRDLEVGSKVLVSNYNHTYLQEVTSISPTGRLTIGSSIYNEHGYQMGPRHGWRLSQCTEEALKKYLEQVSIEKLKTRISQVMDRRHHIEWEEKDLIDVWNIIKKYHKKEEQ